PVGGLVDLVALVLEGHPQGQPDLIVVLDEQEGVHSRTIVAWDEAFCVVTEIAHRRGAAVTDAHDDDDCSRCPGGVPSSPWCLTGSGDLLPHWHRARKTPDAPAHQGQPALRGDRVG